MDMIEKMETRDQVESFKKFDARLREVAKAFAAYEAGFEPEDVIHMDVKRWSFIDGIGRRDDRPSEISITVKVLCKDPENTSGRAAYDEEYDEDVVRSLLILTFEESVLWSNDWREDAARAGLKTRLWWARRRYRDAIERVARLKNETLPEAEKQVAKYDAQCDSWAAKLTALGVDVGSLPSPLDDD